MNYTPYISNPRNWKDHFVKMMKNNKRKDFYTVSNHDSPQAHTKDIQIVSPTQQNVEQAKQSLKRNLDSVSFTHSAPVKKKRKTKKAHSVSKRQRRKK